MGRSHLRIIALVLAAPLLLVPGSPRASDRALPMRFELRKQGPAETCSTDCKLFIAASGAITAETPRHFLLFAQNHDLGGATVVVDSDGGSVLGAIALGREIRKLKLATTVGRFVDVPGGKDEGRASLLTNADCESMCAFVLLGGVTRSVPSDARVMVHQIWLGDRRDDPTAANYSAEDLVVVQRDIGRLAQYTVEMGGGIDLLEIALKIPPWEPMRQLSRDELRNMKIVTAGEASESREPSSSPSATTSAGLSKTGLSNGARAAVNNRAWAVLTNAGDGRTALGRTHPLTIEGADLGVFDLSFSCGEQGRDFAVSYFEQRRASEPGKLPAALREVEITMLGRSMPLKVVSSRAPDKAGELTSVATGRIPVDLVQTFAERNGRSLTIETVSPDATTVIRVGNAGIGRVLPSLVSSCAATASRVRNSARHPSGKWARIGD